jgi:nicotinamide-nucleotide amidase
VLGVDLRLTAWNLPVEEAERRLAAGCHEIVARAGEWVYGEDEEDLAAQVLQQARGRRWKLATAESCTGGGVGMRLTEVPGSSEVYLGGLIAYDNQVKASGLGVPAGLFTAHGAVSEPVAVAMARGAAQHFGAELAIAVTGIAGPGGGTPEKPVGLVHLAAALQGEVQTRRLIFPGNRHEIRARAAQAALFLLYQGLARLKDAASLPT